jgi:hypothetical protein
MEKAHAAKSGEYDVCSGNGASYGQSFHGDEDFSRCHPRMEAARSSEIVISCHTTTQHHNPAYHNWNSNIITYFGQNRFIGSTVLKDVLLLCQICMSFSINSPSQTFQNLKVEIRR